MDEFLNVFYFVLHSAWLGFVCLGWIWRATRLWHLVFVALTGLSWFGLGIWYGWGYCPFTDWHWEVRERLGYRDDPPSYTQLLMEQVTGVDMSPETASYITVGGFAIALVLTIVLNIRDRRR